MKRPSSNGKFIANCSFGKDSLATIILAIKHEEPLDEAVYCEVMFDENTSGEVPEHKDFIHNVAIPRLAQWGIKTVVLRSEKNYVSCFTRKILRGSKIGKISAFPLCGKCSIQRDCKIPPIEKYKRELGGDVTQYLGIAKDETDRLMRLDGINKVSLLDRYGITEAMAFELCRAENLLSPIYAYTDRGGCWFCPNAKRKELRHLYDFHPALWARMLLLQALPNKATERFNRTQKFSDIDYQFRIADENQIKEEKP